MPAALPIGRIAAAVAAALLAACASTPPACEAGAKAWVQDTLYFGRARAGGPEISLAEWASFLDTEVTPRFPAGLTHWKAEGQWSATPGTPPLREASFVLTLAHGPGSDAEVAALQAAYRTRFAQDAVLRVRTPACVSF